MDKAKEDKGKKFNKNKEDKINKSSKDTIKPQTFGNGENTDRLSK